MSKPIRILHVEDNPFDRSLVRHTLEKVPGDFTLITIPTLIGESKMSMRALGLVMGQILTKPLTLY